MEKASLRDSARLMAVWVLAFSRAPSVFSASCKGGSLGGALPAEKASAQLSRLTTPSADAQSLASSDQPFGDGAEKGRWPSSFSTGVISRPGASPIERYLEMRNS